MADTIRPGGIRLTLHALELLSLGEGSRILDVGCGSGATVSLLRSSGFDAYGVDIALPEGAPPELLCADAATLPFDNGSFDAVFFECSLSKISNPKASLFEARRVIRLGGKLAVSDLFTNADDKKLDGLLGRLESRSVIERRIEAAGFGLLAFEEHRDALAEFWGQLIFDNGLREAKRLVGNCDMKTDSYFLALFEAL